MTRRFLSRLTMGAALTLLGLGTLAWAAPSLLLTAKLEKGGWTVVDRDGGSAARRLCFGDAAQLIQIEHGPVPCRYYVIENKPQSLVVHYSCEGAGYGRTTIRRETNRLVQVDTQGVHRGRIFEHKYEARRTGSCGR